MKRFLTWIFLFIPALSMAQEMGLEGLYLYRQPEALQHRGFLVLEGEKTYEFIPVVFPTRDGRHLSDFSQFQKENRTLLLMPDEMGQFVLKDLYRSRQKLTPIPGGFVGEQLPQGKEIPFPVRLIRVEPFYRTLILDPQGRRMNGADVKDIQMMLVNMGIDVGPEGIDGWYGPHTYAAVKSFQRNHNLEDNGIVTPELWALIIDQSRFAKKQ